MWDKLFDFFVDTLIACFLPLVYLYHTATSDYFLNVAAEDASGLEKVSNELLIPYQFIFSGRSAIPRESGQWEFQPRFVLDNAFWPKMTLSLAALPASLVVGGAVKSLSFLSADTRQRYHSMKNFYRPQAIIPLQQTYEAMGLFLGDPEHAEFFPSLSYQRQPGDEQHLREEKEGLREIAKRLNQAGIPWWVDCGTCLGVYRYGGTIPWDGDIDIAILLPDFDNALSALSTLDPTQYIVQDWSSREHPKSFIKVFLRKNASWIDIYHFAIDPQKRELRYVFSLENHTFFPEWWKIRERRFKVASPFEEIFPLKKGLLDGVEVFLPNDPKRYLQARYGENLAPVKIYDPSTGTYEKDLSHPYWQRAYTH